MGGLLKKIFSEHYVSIAGGPFLEPGLEVVYMTCCSMFIGIVQILSTVRCLKASMVLGGSA